MRMESRERVPARYRKNAQTAALLDSLGLSAQQLAELVENVKAQFFVDTATWSLPIWEYQAGITPAAGATAAARRNAIKASLLSIGTTTESVVCTMATMMTGYASRIRSNGDYSFTLELLGETDDLIEMDMSGLTAAVKPICPAHLRFLIAALTWERLEAVDMTWATLESRNMTWERLEASVPIIGTE